MKTTQEQIISSRKLCSISKLCWWSALVALWIALPASGETWCDQKLKDPECYQFDPPPKSCKVIASMCKNEALLDTLQCYADEYPDLKNEYCAQGGGCDFFGLWSHWKQWGKREGRDKCFSEPTSFCCNIKFWENIGHSLTETVLTATLCERWLAWKNDPLLPAGATDAILTNNATLTKRLQVTDAISRAFGSRFVSRHKCNIQYTRLAKNTTKYPDAPIESIHSQEITQANDLTRRPRPLVDTHTSTCAYWSMVKKAPSWTCLAYEGWSSTATRLEYFQRRILSSCGIPNLRHQPKPSSRVMIIVRNRGLRNAGNLLKQCRDLRLRCAFFNASLLTSHAPSNVCKILANFKDNPLVVGVQGPELVYPFLLSLRHLLLRSRGYKTSYKGPKATCHAFVNKTGRFPAFGAREELVRKNFRNGRGDIYYTNRSCTGLDHWNLEFSQHFGTEVTHVAELDNHVYPPAGHHSPDLDMRLHPQVFVDHLNELIAAGKLTQVESR